MSGHLHTLKFVFLCSFVVLCIFQSLYVLPDTFPNLLTCVLRWRRCGQAWLPPLCYVPLLVYALIPSASLPITVSFGPKMFKVASVSHMPYRQMLCRGHRPSGYGASILYF